MVWLPSELHRKVFHDRAQVLFQFTCSGQSRVVRQNDLAGGPTNADTSCLI
jgi:hypothetical protein